MTPLSVDASAAGSRPPGLDPSVFVHSHALCETPNVGPRTRIWAFAHLSPEAEVGADCNICDGAYIENGARVGDRVTVKNAVLLWKRVTVEDDVFLGPGVVFTNDLRPRSEIKRGHGELLPTLVRAGVTIGANATVVCGLTIGPYAFVAAGAVVAADVEAHALVAGNPGRRTGWVCRCGERLGNDLRCLCGLTYEPAATGGLKRNSR